MTSTPPVSDHLDEATLVRVLDGDDDVSAGVFVHLDRCETCRAQLAALRRSARALHDAYRSLPVPARLGEPPSALRARTGSRSPWRRVGHSRSWRIAAVLVAFAAAAAAASPAVRTMVRTFAARIGAVGHTAAAPSAPDAAPRATLHAAMEFDVAGSVATLSFDHAPGIVQLHAGEGSGLAVAVRLSRTSKDSSARLPELVALPASVRILNAGRADDSYDVGIPSGVRLVRVLVAGREVASSSRAELSRTPAVVFNGRTGARPPEP